MPKAEAGSEAVQRLDSLHELETIAAVATAVCFGAGTVSMNENEKRRALGAW